MLTDVGDELNLTVETIETVLTSKTTAIIMPHLFGNPADMGEIVELAQSRNIRVIDDAAQALGATIDGRPAGSFGDAGIVSFGNEKICSGIGGGAVVSRDKRVLAGGLHLKLAPPSCLLPLRRLLSTLLWHRWRRWTAPLRQIGSRWRGTDPGTVLEPYRRESMANLSAAVAATLMETLGENIAARRARVQRLSKTARRRGAVSSHRAPDRLGVSGASGSGVCGEDVVEDFASRRSNRLRSATPDMKCKAATCRSIYSAISADVSGINFRIRSEFGRIWSSCLASLA